MRIDNIQIDNPVFPAPMAGVTDFPFRKVIRSLCSKNGYNILQITEMVACQAMIRYHKNTIKMATPLENERPLSVQMVGHEPEAMAEAAKMIEGFGADIIDINMGCPVKKIVNNGNGSALMKDERAAAAALSAVVSAVNVPVTVKIRAGWDVDSINAPSFAKILEECGAKMITVHGRTRGQFYSGRANREVIKAVKEAVSVPVIGNGDISCPMDAKSMMDGTGCDGVMVGRALFGRPYLPVQIAHYLKTGEIMDDPTVEEMLSILLEHFDALIEYYGDYTGVRMARKHIAWYSKGLHGSASFRSEINRIEDKDIVRAMVLKFYEDAMNSDPVIDDVLNK
ncbi:MAG: tRNA dihydrouridine synthase DusB [Alphaproteobacteria bacterium]|nr:tRNA dihydrouridine synthase DusB [Alphaproteobacteria bacterium]